LKKIVNIALKSEMSQTFLQQYFVLQNARLLWHGESIYES